MPSRWDFLFCFGEAKLNFIPSLWLLFLSFKSNIYSINNAFQIFVEETFNEFKYMMHVIEDQEVELIIPSQDGKQPSAVWYRVSTLNKVSFHNYKGSASVRETQTIALSRCIF